MTLLTRKKVKISKERYFPWDHNSGLDFQVLVKESDKCRLLPLLRESLLILRGDPSLNIYVKSIPLELLQ